MDADRYVVHDTGLRADVLGQHGRALGQTAELGVVTVKDQELFDSLVA